MKRFLLTLVLISVAFLTAFSQAEDKILLLTGNVIEGTVTNEDSAFIYYDFYKKSGKAKANAIPKVRTT